MLNGKVIVCSAGKLYGPFENAKMASGWLDNHDSIREAGAETYNLREVKPATVEHAEECGTRIAAAA